MDPPPKHVENHLQSAEFWTNKILLENRTAPHVDWVKALKDLLKGLCTYVKTYHFSGPAWNPNGIPLSQFKPGSAPASGQMRLMLSWDRICIICEEISL